MTLDKFTTTPNTASVTTHKKTGLERAAGLLEEDENQDGYSDLRAH